MYSSHFSFLDFLDSTSFQSSISLKYTIPFLEKDGCGSGESLILSGSHKAIDGGSDVLLKIFCPFLYAVFTHLRQHPTLFKAYEANRPLSEVSFTRPEKQWTCPASRNKDLAPNCIVGRKRNPDAFPSHKQETPFPVSLYT